MKNKDKNYNLKYIFLVYKNHFLFWNDIVSS